MMFLVSVIEEIIWVVLPAWSIVSECGLGDKDGSVKEHGLE